MIMIFHVEEFDLPDLSVDVTYGDAVSRARQLTHDRFYFYSLTFSAAICDGWDQHRHIRRSMAAHNSSIGL